MSEEFRSPDGQVIFSGKTVEIKGGLTVTNKDGRVTVAVKKAGREAVVHEVDESVEPVEPVELWRRIARLEALVQESERVLGYIGENGTDSSIAEALYAHLADLREGLGR